MNEEIEIVLQKVEISVELSENEKESVRGEIYHLAITNTSSFISIVKMIPITRATVLYEVYRSLSQQPEKWVNFISSEFDRVRQQYRELYKTQKKRNLDIQNKYAYILDGFSFFLQKDFPRENVLSKKLKTGVFATSEVIAKKHIDLLYAYYLKDKTKNKDYFSIITSYAQYQNDIGFYAQKLLYGKVTNKKDKKEEVGFINWQEIFNTYTIYSSLVYVGGFFGFLLLQNLINKSFVENDVVLTMGFIGAVLSGIVHKTILFSKRKEQLPLLIAFLCAYGIISSFLFMFINTLESSNPQKLEKHKIIDTGEMASGRYLGGQKYAIIHRNGVKKQVYVHISKNDNLKSYKYLEIYVRKGVFDIETIEDITLTRDKILIPKK